MLGKPFETVYYLYWWLPGSKSSCNHKKGCVDDDGGYEEFDTISNAVEAIEILKKQDSGLTDQHVFAVVKETRYTVKIIHPRKKPRKQKYQHHGVL